MKKQSFIGFLEDAGFNTEGIIPESNLLDIFKTIGVDKLVICDDARTFDTRNMDQMKAEGRVFHEISLRETDSSDV